MVRVLRVHAPGPPSSLVVDDVALAPLAPGEVRVRHTAIGVNYIDVYQRSGAYPLSLPSSIGGEAAGVVEELGPGPGNGHLTVGDRVAYVWREPGAYADKRNVPAKHLLPLPADIPDDVAAGIMLKGLTAEYLLRRTFRVDSKHTIVVHAAAGGVGSLLCRWGRALGARVIAIVSTDDKARVALQAGAHHVLLQNGAVGLATRVREMAPDGVDVVYDSVGKDTFNASLSMLKRRGMLALFGQASGAVEPFAPAILAQKGSLFLTRPNLFDYIADPGEYRAAADALFDALKKGHVVPHVSARYPLAEAARAHEDLEARRTTGALVLIP